MAWMNASMAKILDAEILMDDRVVDLERGRDGVVPDRALLHHGEPAGDAASSRHVADAEPRQLVRRQAGDGIAAEHDLALARTHEAHDGLERGALADAVAPQQAHDLAAADLQRTSVQDVT